MIMEYNFMLLSLEPELMGELVEKGQLVLENLMDIQQAYEEFVAAIEVEWTPQRVREYLLERRRGAYSFYAKKAKGLEAKNVDERRRGVSYAKRQAYSRQIALLQRMAGETAELGRVLKHSPLKPAGEYITPIDVSFIQNRGFARHLDLWCITA